MKLISIIFLYLLPFGSNAVRLPRSTSESNFDCTHAGFNFGPDGTNCPDAKWTDLMVLSDPDPDKVILNIGCNKGNDMIGWMERWDASATFNTGAWIEHYDKVLGSSRGEGWACKPRTPLKRTTVSSQKHPIGVCVEAMQANVEMLQTTASLFGYNNKSLHFVHAAAVAQHKAGETVDFPDGKIGKETNSIPIKFARSITPLKTVDEIVSEYKLPRVDILSIDTEGWDSDVLRGSMKALSSVRFLEFEVHRDFKGTPWSKTTVKAVTDDLHQMGFDCFWAGNNGKLLNVNACYHKRMERGGWSNMACVKRGDVWWKNLQQFAK